MTPPPATGERNDGRGVPTRGRTLGMASLEPTEPGVMMFAALLLGAVALAAGWIPAWRASRPDPVAAFHEE
ncbi:MAG: hypothetical protein M3282_06645 [Gemmatimonadota bacterium]|nr:hypothetical protein [Gemmatimonadota bacterium]